MSHSYEARLIANTTYQRTIASAIADAVMKYRFATMRRPQR